MKSRHKGVRALRHLYIDAYGRWAGGRYQLCLLMLIWLADCRLPRSRRSSNNGWIPAGVDITMFIWIFQWFFTSNENNVGVFFMKGFIEQRSSL